MNQRNHTHENNDLMDTLEHSILDIDTTDKREQRKSRRKALFATIGIATVAAVFAATATRPEAAPSNPATTIEISNEAWINIAEFDDYGEGGRSVFEDTVLQMRPDLLEYSKDDDGNLLLDNDGKPVKNTSQTRVNIEREFGVSINEEGKKIQEIAGGDEAQHGAEVMFEYDGKEFHYSPIDN